MMLKGHIQKSPYDSPDLTKAWQDLAAAKTLPPGAERVEKISRYTAVVRKLWTEEGIDQKVNTVPQGDKEVIIGVPSSQIKHIEIQTDKVSEIGVTLLALLEEVERHEPNVRSGLDRHFAVVRTDLSKVVAYWEKFVAPTQEQKGEPNAESD